MKKTAFLDEYRERLLGADPTQHKSNRDKLIEIAAQEPWEAPRASGIGAGVGGSAGAAVGGLMAIFGKTPLEIVSYSGRKAIPHSQWLTRVLPGVGVGAAFGAGVGYYLKSRRDRQIDLARKLMHASSADERVKDEAIAQLDLIK